MSVIQNPIIGQARGKFANAVFSTWKGKNVMRSKALSVANPQTDAQMQQRSKFDIALGYARIFGSLLRIGFKEVAVGKTAYNAFMSENLKNDFLTWDIDHWEADATKMVLGKGSLDVTAPTSIAANANADTVTINFAADGGGNTSGTDKLYVVLGNDTSRGMSGGAVVRSAGTAVISISGGLAAGDTLQGYLIFTNASGNKVSDSQFITITA